MLGYKIIGFLIESNKTTKMKNASLEIEGAMGQIKQQMSKLESIAKETISKSKAGSGWAMGTRGFKSEGK